MVLAVIVPHCFCFLQRLLWITHTGALGAGSRFGSSWGCTRFVVRGIVNFYPGLRLIVTKHFVTGTFPSSWEMLCDLCPQDRRLLPLNCDCSWIDCVRMENGWSQFLTGLPGGIFATCLCFYLDLIWFLSLLISGCSFDEKSYSISLNTLAFVSHPIAWNKEGALAVADRTLNPSWSVPSTVKSKGKNGTLICRPLLAQGFVAGAGCQWLPYEQAHREAGWLVLHRANRSFADCLGWTLESCCILAVVFACV